MGFANTTRRFLMKCIMGGCPGVYEERLITQTYHRGDRLVVVDQIPAEVCPICGDTLLRPDTVERIERLLANSQEPSRLAPVYMLP